MVLTRDLSKGGAERQIANFANAIRQHQDVRLTVVLMYETVGYDIAPSPNVEVLALRKRGRWDVFSFIRRLLALARCKRPDIVYAFLPVPCLLSLLLGVVRPGVKVVWSVRASGLEPGRYGLFAAIAEHLFRCLLWVPPAIVCNSKAAIREIESRRQLSPRSLHFVPNGIDTDAFREVTAASHVVDRTSLGVPENAALFVAVGRLDPMKGYENLLDAFQLAFASDSTVWLLVVGDGHGAYADALRKRILSSHAGRVVYVPSADSRSLLPACDFLVSPSVFGEGFSNVLAEAMSCGLACVATDVGDAADIVGDAGFVVPAGDVSALSGAMRELRGMTMGDRKSLGARARTRVIGNFSVARMVGGTLEVFELVRSR